MTETIDYNPLMQFLCNYQDIMHRVVSFPIDYYMEVPCPTLTVAEAERIASAPVESSDVPATPVDLKIDMRKASGQEYQGYPRTTIMVPPDATDIAFPNSVEAYGDEDTLKGIITALFDGTYQISFDDYRNDTYYPCIQMVAPGLPSLNVDLDTDMSHHQCRFRAYKLDTETQSELLNMDIEITPTIGNWRIHDNNRVSLEQEVAMLQKWDIEAHNIPVATLSDDQLVQELPKSHDKTCDIIASWKICDLATNYRSYDYRDRGVYVHAWGVNARHPYQSGVSDYTVVHITSYGSGHEPVIDSHWTIDMRLTAQQVEALYPLLWSGATIKRTRQ
jgi:hypothetical protein